MPSQSRPAQGPDEADDAALGLRGRKKARRREEIIAAARDLFARQGIDATTMAEIAEAAGVSPPTVFNYFGSKDGILLAMIDEGLRRARESDRRLPRPQGADLGTLILLLLSRVSARTLEIGSKRVWRYAEAAVIRHPQAELSRSYKYVSAELVAAITAFVDDYELVTRAGQTCPAPLLAQMLYDLWMPCFLELITDDDQSLADHDIRVRERLLPMLGLLFDTASAATPARKRTAP